jgi:hypothetical protein
MIIHGMMMNTLSIKDQDQTLRLKQMNIVHRLIVNLQSTITSSIVKFLINNHNFQTLVETHILMKNIMAHLQRYKVPNA